MIVDAQPHASGACATDAPPYSARNDRAGSILVARRDGM